MTPTVFSVLSTTVNYCQQSQQNQGLHEKGPVIIRGLFYHFGEVFGEEVERYDVIGFHQFHNYLLIFYRLRSPM